MRNISMAWMKEAFIARRKSETRRYWDDKYAKRTHVGERLRAYDKIPMFGGKCIGILEVTEKPYKEKTGKMTESEYEAEGFAFLAENKLKFRGKDPRQAFDDWKKEDTEPWVIKFRIVEVRGG